MQDASVRGPIDAPGVPLAKRLRTAGAGYDEWRVQDPERGIYVIAFSRSEVANPEREAREWLAYHVRNFPDSRFPKYVVAKVHVQTQADELMQEAAAELTRVTEVAEELSALRDRLADLLSRTAVALRGPEPPLTRWSWHDVPERAAAAIAAIDVMQRAAVMAADPDTPRALDSQHVLKATAARPDATDREHPAMASPVGGPMGAGQAAAAAPLTSRPR